MASKFSISDALQRMIVGFSGKKSTPMLKRMIENGLAGVIFFRDNFQDPVTGEVSSPNEIVDLLATLQDYRPAGSPPLILSIDQEGGPVERLPHTIFPSLPSPRAFQNNLPLAKEAYTLLAEQLVAYGFNLDYFPTLDVHLNPANPIIGERAFSGDPARVAELAKIALVCFQKAGLVAVGKHFPGHGNGTVDSHLTLPTLVFTPEELSAFQTLIEAGLPSVMVSHGYYPALQQGKETPDTPASASPVVIQQLLRGRCGFQGVVFSDDMLMGAILEKQHPVQSALQALGAGIDCLLYRQSTAQEWRVAEGIAQQLNAGGLDADAHQHSLSRLKALRDGLSPARHEKRLSPADCQARSLSIAERALSVNGQWPVLKPEDQVLLVYPDRRCIPAYAWDTSTAPDLAELLAPHIQPAQLQAIAYHPMEPAKTVCDWDALAPPTQLWLVSFNPSRYPEQRAWLAQFQYKFPNSQVLFIHAGLEDSFDDLSAPLEWAHIILGSYRPQFQQAFLDRLFTE